MTSMPAMTSLRLPNFTPDSHFFKWCAFNFLLFSALFFGFLALTYSAQRQDRIAMHVMQAQRLAGNAVVDKVDGRLHLLGGNPIAGETVLLLDADGRILAQKGESFSQELLPLPERTPAHSAMDANGKDMTLSTGGNLYFLSFRHPEGPPAFHEAEGGSLPKTDKGAFILGVVRLEGLYGPFPLWLGYAGFGLAYLLMASSFAFGFFLIYKRQICLQEKQRALAGFLRATQQAGLIGWRYDDATENLHFDYPPPDAERALGPLFAMSQDIKSNQSQKGQNGIHIKLAQFLRFIHKEDQEAAQSLFKHAARQARAGKTSTGISARTIRILGENDQYCPYNIIPFACSSRQMLRGFLHNTAPLQRQLHFWREKAEEKFLPLFKNNLQPALIWDANGTLRCWNESFRSTFAIDPQLLFCGMSSHRLFSLLPFAGDKAAAISPMPKQKQERHEEQGRLEESGRSFHVYRFSIANGRTAVFLTDISVLGATIRMMRKKIKNLEADLVALKKDNRQLHASVGDYTRKIVLAGEAVRSRNILLTDISHDLRTPLNAINGFSEIMLAELYGPLGNRRYKEYVSDILDAGKNLLFLVDKTLNVSYHDVKNVELRPKRLDLRKILHAQISYMLPDLFERNIRIATSFTTLPSVWADEKSVRLSLTSLLKATLACTRNDNVVQVDANVTLDCVCLFFRCDNRFVLNTQKSNTDGIKMKGDDEPGMDFFANLLSGQGGLLRIEEDPPGGCRLTLCLPRREGVIAKMPDPLTQKFHFAPAPSVAMREAPLSYPAPQTLVKAAKPPSLE